MLKYWRVLLLVVMLLGSIMAIGLKAFPQGREGVEIIYITQSSPARDVLEPGMVVTKFNGAPVKNLRDWNSAVAGISGNVSLIANGVKHEFPAEGLGINVIGIERTNLDFGLDLKGGTRIILKPEGNVTEETLDQTISVLETRSNLFGLQEIKFFPVKSVNGDFFIQIEAAGVGSEIVDELLSKQGVFEGEILKPVDVSNGTASLDIGSSSTEIIFLGEEIVVEGETVGVNGTFSFGGIDFEYLNMSEGRIMLMAKIFDGEDIELVHTGPRSSGILPRGDFYEFFFSVSVSTEGAQRFADITRDMPAFFDINSGSEYLESPLLLLIDGKVVSSLRIGGSLAGDAIQTPQISGSEATQEAAIQERLRLQTILRSGALPIALEAVSVDIVSPTLGEGFFYSAGIAVALAALTVLVIVFIRYRKLKVAVPLTLVGISEVIIILGIAATNDAGIWSVVLVVNIALISIAWWKKHEIDVYAWFGAVLIPLIGLASWTIDLPAIAGIMAAIGSGVDHQIIIADEALRRERKIFGIRIQIRRAFFIIMGAALTTIFAMLPLMFVGVGLVRGFAITTIAGVLVGILITRPAYAKLAEKFT